MGVVRSAPRTTTMTICAVDEVADATDTDPDSPPAAHARTHFEVGLDVLARSDACTFVYPAGVVNSVVDPIEIPPKISSRSSARIPPGTLGYGTEIAVVAAGVRWATVPTHHEIATGHPLPDE